MFGSHGPSFLLTQSVNGLMQHLPGVRDGVEESIHQSRVAIRRTRETLALARTTLDDDELAAIEWRLAAGFRALGRARDADIAHKLVHHMELRFPLAPATLGHLRSSVIAEQLLTRRKVIKKLEKLNLDMLPQQLRHIARAKFTLRDADWKGPLRHQLARRAEGVRTSLQHASGVYLPNRAHSVRVAMKQLRYTMELADITGAWRAPLALRVLKKAQKALGEAHDRELLLLARLRDLARAGAELKQTEVNAVEQFIRAEAVALHSRYVARRSDILLICDACESALRSRSLRAGALLAVGVAVPSLLLLSRNDP